MIDISEVVYVYELDKDVPLRYHAKRTSPIGAVHAPDNDCTINPAKQGTEKSLTEPDLLKSIEILREQLVELVRKHDFSSDAVVKLSQRLDKYILEAQTRMIGKS